jgi:hypothetical protein
MKHNYQAYNVAAESNVRGLKSKRSLCARHEKAVERVTKYHRSAKLLEPAFIHK